MRQVSKESIFQAVYNMILHSSRNMPKDASEALKKASENETGVAKEVLNQLLENEKLAVEDNIPLCQDTGTAVFFVEHGEDLKIEGGLLSDILNEAMVKAYADGFLRKSMCDPISRQNTKDNTPAIIHTELVSGSNLRISYMAKGGGAENMSQVKMLVPSDGLDGIYNFVIECVKKAGPNPCPPTVIGVGIGGTFDLVAMLAKKALFRKIGEYNADERVAGYEKELLERINKLGIGPMGLGGKTTSYDVKINLHPCHIASLPVAVNIQCHSIRHGEVIF